MGQTPATAQPAYQPFLATVARKERLSPHFMRLTFTGPELGHFAANGFGQHIKIILPLQGGRSRDDGSDRSQATARVRDPFFDALLKPQAIARMDWWDQWRALPPARRNTMRTYTIRAVDQSRREVTVDMVTHPGAGPAGTFAQAARQGDQVVLIGPNSLATGSADSISFQPEGALTILLAGDETAAPAIASIAETLIEKTLAHDEKPPRSSRQRTVDIYIEVPESSDAITDYVTANGPGPAISLHWVARNGAPRGERLLASLRDFYQPISTRRENGSGLASQAPVATAPAAPAAKQQPEYAWIAAEANTTHALRRLLTDELHMPKDRVTFYSYWRDGKPEM